MTSSIDNARNLAMVRPPARESRGPRAAPLALVLRREVRGLQVAADPDVPHGRCLTSGAGGLSAAGAVIAPPAAGWVPQGHRDLSTGLGL